MRGRFVGIVGATVLALSILALVEHENRAGPYDLELEPTPLDLRLQGMYHARPDQSVVPGVCTPDPCRPYTSIEVRVDGLPPALYEARLDGEGTRAVGPLVPDGAGFLLRWSEVEDHTSKQRLVILLAGRDIASIAVGPSVEPRRIDTAAVAMWPGSGGSVHLAEIGGVTISTMVRLQVSDGPPPGWSLHAHLEGAAGTVPLGALDVEDGKASGEARIERLPLEDQRRVVVLLRPDTMAAGGFPILLGDLPEP